MKCDAFRKVPSPPTAIAMPVSRKSDEFSDFLSERMYWTFFDCSDFSTTLRAVSCSPLKGFEYTTRIFSMIAQYSPEVLNFYCLIWKFQILFRNLYKPNLSPPKQSPSQARCAKRW